MLFESVAYAMGAAPQGGGEQGNPIMAFAPLIIMFLIFYFLLIRPQQKKQKEHKDLLAGLKRGDYVLTNGGLYGRITDVDGDVMTIELSDNLEVKVNRGYVAGMADAPKGGKKKKSDNKD